MPRIALIHAVMVAMEPIQAAFRELWPEAECINILDDALSPDRARDNALSAAMTDRIGHLANYALSASADGILFTCSAFGPAIDAAGRRLGVPVLKPNEAMFEKALGHGSRIGMLATFAPSVATMTEEFEEQTKLTGKRASLETILVPEAMTALKHGDVETHNRLLAARAADLRDCNAVMLAHFSTSRAKEAVAAVVTCPVLTSPDSAVETLKGHFPRPAPSAPAVNC